MNLNSKLVDNGEGRVMIWYWAGNNKGVRQVDVSQKERSEGEEKWPFDHKHDNDHNKVSTLWSDALEFI